MILMHSFISYLFFINLQHLSPGSGKNHLTMSGVCKLEQESVHYLKIIHTFNNRLTSHVCFQLEKGTIQI